MLANIAADLGLVVYVQVDNQVTEEERRLGKSPSIWLVMTPDPDNLQPLLAGDRWKPCRTDPEAGLWTDAQSNLLRAMRWNWTNRN